MTLGELKKQIAELEADGHVTNKTDVLIKVYIDDGYDYENIRELSLNPSNDIIIETE